MEVSRARIWQALAGIAVVAFGAALLLAHAGGSLHNTDDVLYAQVIRELATRGDPLHLTWHGAPFVAKPPLFYWAGALLTRWLGENELVLRLPALLSGIALLGMVYALCCKLVRDLWVSAAIALWLLLSSTFFEFARRVMLDVPLAAAAFAATALLCAFPSSRIAWLAAGAMAGIAALIKSVGAGPLLLLPAIYFTWLALQRRQLVQLACGALGFAGVVAPWLIAVRPAGALADQTGLNLVKGQAFVPTQFSKPAAFYLDMIWQTEPWYLLASVVGVALSAVLIRRTRVPHAPLLLALGPSVLVILSAMSAKLPNYLTETSAGLALAWLVPIDALAQRAPRLLKPLVLGLAVACPLVHLPYLVGNPFLVDPSRDLKALSQEVVKTAPPGSQLLVVNIYFLVPDYYTRIPTRMVARQANVFDMINGVPEFRHTKSIVAWDYPELGRRLAEPPAQFALMLTSRFEQHRAELGAVRLIATAGEYCLLSNQKEKPTR